MIINKAAFKNHIISIAPSLFRKRAFKRIDTATQDTVMYKGVELELFLLEKLIRQDTAFFDVGANIGDYLHVAGKYLPSNLIYGFEPQPILADRLRALFPDDTIEAIAFSDTEKTATLKIPLIHGQAYTSRATLTKIREEGEDGAETLSVPTTTIDQYRTKLADTSVGCIKIDVEGHERSVIAGAHNTIIDNKPNLIVEIEQRHHTEPISEIFNDIICLGYVGWFINIHEHRVAPISEFSVDLHQNLSKFKTSYYLNNFIFIPKEVSLSLDFPHLPQNI